MSKFKVGNIITGKPNNNYTCTTTNATMEVIETNDDGRQMKVRITAHKTQPGEVGSIYDVMNSTDRFSLLREDATTVKERSTYRLLKATAELKVGAVVQEKCDDGDQDYIVLDESFVKYENESGGKRYTLPRGAVENEQKWFVEVFKVTPEYMTREELDQWEAFKKQRTSKVVSAPVKAAAKTGKHMSTYWTPARRKAHARRMRAVWAAKNKAA